MNVIEQPNQEILNRLGGIQILMPNKKYRMNRFVIEERLGDRIVLYNSFTQALMDVNEEEYNNCINLVRDVDYVDFFFRNYFVVPEDYDEHAVIKTVLEKYRTQVDENYLKNTNLYTILPTTGCNARCFYCYELGTKTKVMTKETAEKIAQLIVRRYKNQENENPNDDHFVKLHWFGGEPTMNSNIIDTICGILEANGVNYSGDIISNGYLFNEELSKKAKELWKLDSAQITLDGTEEVYNKTKAYVYKDDPNPFKTVIGNIRNLISNGIRVNIRINVDLYNADDVKSLIPQIYDEFGPDELISVYAYPLFEGHGVKRDAEHLKKTVDALEEIGDVLEQCGYVYPLSHTDRVVSHHCMADGGNSLMFAPDGSIGLCEHYVDSGFIGHIDDPDNLNMELVKEYWEREEDLDICSDCSWYLDCIRLKKCEDLRVCNEETKRWRNNQIKRRVRLRVQKYYEENGNNFCNSNNSFESELNEIKESLRVLHNKIDTIFNLLNR